MITAPTTDARMADIATDIVTADTYAAIAAAADDADPNSFDPTLVTLTLTGLAYDLLPPEQDLPHVRVPHSRDSQQAITACQDALRRAGTKTAELLNGSELKTQQRYLLASTLTTLHDSYLQLFGARW